MNYGLVIRLRPVEGMPAPNLYFPTVQMNVNIKAEKTDFAVCYLMKIDDRLPVGEFIIELMYTPLRDTEYIYQGNGLHFVPQIQPIKLHVKKSSTDPIERTQEVFVQGKEITNPAIEPQDPITFEACEFNETDVHSDIDEVLEENQGPWINDRQNF